MSLHTVTANELASKALRCPQDRARVVYHVDGHGNDGLFTSRAPARKRGTCALGSEVNAPKICRLGVGLTLRPVGRANARRRLLSQSPKARTHGSSAPRRGVADHTPRRSLCRMVGDGGHRKAYARSRGVALSHDIRGGHQIIFGEWTGRTRKTGIGHIPIPEITLSL
jgi:hypothetical protein